MCKNVLNAAALYNIAKTWLSLHTLPTLVDGYMLSMTNCFVSFPINSRIRTRATLNTADFESEKFRGSIDEISIVDSKASKHKQISDATKC